MGLREREELNGYEKCQSPRSQRSVSLIGYFVNRTTHYLSFSTSQRLASVPILPSAVPSCLRIGGRHRERSQ